MVTWHFGLLNSIFYFEPSLESILHFKVTTFRVRLRPDGDARLWGLCFRVGAGLCFLAHCLCPPTVDFISLFFLGCLLTLP